MVAGSLPGRTQTLSIAIYDAVAAGEDQTAHFLVLVSSLICVIVLVASSKLLRTSYMRLRAA
jgi:molybdate transport system permease protein